MADEENHSNYSGGGFISLVVFILVGIWVWHHVIHRVDYSKPWFSGTETVHACSPSAQSIADCYVLSAVSNGSTITRITFNNGGYKVSHGGSCFEAYADPLFDKEKRACVLIDDESTKWSIQP